MKSTLWNDWQNTLYSVPTHKFDNGLTEYQIAGQIADLLNSYNHLKTKHTPSTILSDKVKYFIELYGQDVIGCVGLLYELALDKICHLTIKPEFRRKGFGRKLIYRAKEFSQRSAVYMSIREDNIGSLNLATSLGFRAIAYKRTNDYNLLILFMEK
jgi:ribosomal protein S18 acetylase RimI-like enzyme